MRSRAVSWSLARGLSKPIYRLIRSMREVEKGKFLVPLALEREDEIGQLESSYGRMVQRLDELVQSIEEKERQKRDAELYALRARIQPHFLYNTLNSIRMLAMLQQSTQIAKLIQSLNKPLQANMKLDRELVPLEDEIRCAEGLCELDGFEIHECVYGRLADSGVGSPRAGSSHAAAAAA
ncbi:histidine kinase [Paenibacillus sp. P25]|nr:histidine kinase [Paenibacillus sp. P25]